MRTSPSAVTISASSRPAAAVPSASRSCRSRRSAPGRRRHRGAAAALHVAPALRGDRVVGVDPHRAGSIDDGRLRRLRAQPSDERSCRVTVHVPRPYQQRIRRVRGALVAVPAALHHQPQVVCRAKLPPPPRRRCFPPPPHRRWAATSTHRPSHCLGQRGVIAQIKRIPQVPAMLRRRWYWAASTAGKRRFQFEQAAVHVMLQLRPLRGGRPTRLARRDPGGAPASCRGAVAHADAPRDQTSGSNGAARATFNTFRLFRERSALVIRCRTFHEKTKRVEGGSGGAVAAARLVAGGRVGMGHGTPGNSLALPRTAGRAGLAFRRAMAAVATSRGRPPAQTGIAVCRLCHYAAQYHLRRSIAAVAESVLSGRSAGPDPKQWLGRCVDLTAKRVRGRGWQRGGRRCRSELRPHVPLAAGGERRRAQLSGHLGRARFAAGVDAAHEPGEPA